MITPLVVYCGLLLARVGVFVMTLPLLGGAPMPRTVKAGLAIALTAFWAPELLHHAELRPELVGSVTWLAWVVALAREAVIGGVLGFAFGLFLVPARVAGEFVAQEIGLSLGSVLTASGDGGANPLAALLELLAGAALLSLDLHHVFLGVFHATLAQHPVGHWLSVPAFDAVGAVSAVEGWGITLAAPVGLWLFLTTIVLALLSRAAPQMSLYTVGFPLRIGVGLAALLLLLPQIMAGLTNVMTRLSTLFAGGG